MKRCPKCNRAESDDSLAFCRADGTRLVSDGSFVSEGAGTLRFDSAPVTGEAETRMLPTGEGLSRPTAPTTTLDGSADRLMGEPLVRRALDFGGARQQRRWSCGK